MALLRLNYDSLIRPSVSGVLPSSQYAQFSGFNALVGSSVNVGGSKRTGASADIQIPGLKNRVISYPFEYYPGIPGRPSVNLAPIPKVGSSLYNQALTATYGNVLQTWGPQLTRSVRSIASGRPTETTISGQPVSAGGFISNYYNLAATPGLYQSPLGYVPPNQRTGMTGIFGQGGGIGIERLAVLTPTQYFNTQDYLLSQQLRRVPQIASPLAASPGFDFTGYSEARQNLETYVSSLPTRASQAIEQFKTQTATFARPVSMGAFSTGNLGTDVSAELARLQAQSQVTAVSLTIKEPIAKAVASQPLSINIIDSFVPQTNTGSLQVITNPVPTGITSGTVSYIAQASLGGQIRGNEIVTRATSRIPELRETLSVTPKPTTYTSQRYSSSVFKTGANSNVVSSQWSGITVSKRYYT